MLNVGNETPASIKGWGMGERRREIVEEEVGIRREEVSEALKKVKMGKTSGIDGVCG